MDWRFILSLLFALIVAVFAIQNAKPVDINFLTMHISISQALVILISAVFGAVTVFLLNIIKIYTLNIKLKKANKVIAALKKENEQIKETPVEEKNTQTQTSNE